MFFFSSDVSPTATPGEIDCCKCVYSYFDRCVTDPITSVLVNVWTTFAYKISVNLHNLARNHKSYFILSHFFFFGGSLKELCFLMVLRKTHGKTRTQLRGGGRTPPRFFRFLSGRGSPICVVNYLVLSLFLISICLYCCYFSSVSRFMLNILSKSVLL